MSDWIFVEPLVIRRAPASVGELRSFCSEEGWSLPWYYQEEASDAPDDAWARFVPYPLARALAAALEQELPGSLGWCGLPSHPAWPLMLPQDIGLLQESSGTDGSWETSSPSFSRLVDWMQNDFPAGTHELAMMALRAEPLTVRDRWRVLSALRRKGMSGLLPEALRMLHVAASRQIPEILARGARMRLERDWRSLVHLAGIAEAPPDAVWLRPELSAPHSRFGTVEHLGAIGAMGQGAGAALLVPEACAWADVLVWPSRLLNEGWYAEEPPLWP